MSLLTRSSLIWGALASAMVPVAFAGDVQRLDMAQALALALNQGQTMQVAGSKVSAMEAAYEAAQKSSYPTLKLDSNLQRASGQGTTFLATQNRNTAEEPPGVVTGNYMSGNLSFNFPIFDKGVLFYEASPAQTLALANLSAAQASSGSQALDVTNKVAKAYFQALQSQEEASLQGTLLQKRVKELEYIKERVKSRIVTQGDQLEMEVALATSRQAFNAAQRAAAVQLTQLRLLLRLPADAAIELTMPTTDLPQDLPLVEKVIATAIGQRPDIKNQEAQVKVAQAQYEETKAKALPTVGFNSSLIRSSDLSGPQRRFAVAGLTLSYTIADFGQNDSSVKSKALLVQEQEKNVGALRDTATYEAHSAYAAVADMQDKVVVANKKVAQVAYNESATRQLYEAGRLGLDKLLELEDSLLTAKVSLLTSRYAVWSAYADLFKSAGMNYAGDHRFPLSP